MQNLYNFFMHMPTERATKETHAGRTAAGASFRGYGFAVVMVVLSIVAALVFRRIHHANLSLLFLTAVIIVAARCGLWPSIFSSVMSFLALNFFFTPPFYTFKVEEEGDFATLVFFLAMAALTGNLAARMREETGKSRESLDRVSELLDFSRNMAAIANATGALKALAERLSSILQCSAFAYLPDDKGDLQLRAKSSGEDKVASPGTEISAHAWADILRQQTLHAAGWVFLPLVTAGGPVGMVALNVDEIDRDKRALADGLCDQASVAVERTLLVDSLKEAQMESETERLRSALLSSVSHDLRTPLASIIGSTTSVLEYHEVLKPDDRRELLQTVVDEAQRLNRYIQNLLDMTRFGQQPFELQREWVDVNDLVSAAIERLGAVLAKVELEVAVTVDASVIKVQGALLEQVFVNLLDNAAGFSPLNSSMGINVFRDEGAVVIEVSDRGPGIPEHEREKVFDMFYRVSHGDRQRSGTGLGLAICKSVVKAHGGSIEALPGPDGIGTTMRLRLPLAENPTEEG
jgi:two-component system sensor histidine kinase KdpD